MSQSISRRSFLKCAGSGAVSLAAALLTGVPAAAQQPRLAGEPALLDGKAAVELLGYAPAQEMGNVLVYLSVENLSASTLPVGASYLQSREVCTLGDLYSMGTGVTAVCDGKPVRCGSFAAPLYGENAADASVFTLNLTAGRGALLHCFCAVPDNWQTLELTYHPDFAAGRSVTLRSTAALTTPCWAWCPPLLPRSAAWWICNSFSLAYARQLPRRGSLWRKGKLGRIAKASLHDGGSS